MTFIDNLNIQKFHAHKIQRFGSNNARSLAWHSSDEQFNRFETLCRAIDLNQCSVLDIGCGNGDLCVYLNQHFKNITYAGIDLMPEFLNNAIELNKDNPATKFYLGDFMSGQLPEADYVLACGSLNYKHSDPDFIFKAIARMYAACKKGMAFTLLSKTLNPDGILTAYEPEEIISFCKTLSENVLLERNILEGEFMVRITR